MTKLFRRIRYWLESGRRNAELAEEMEFHRAMLARDGAGPTAMGNPTLAREDARAVWIWPWLESLRQDLAYGLRTMRREPGFTITALLALGSAIGINTGLFTIFNAFALRPWPVRDPGSVVVAGRFGRGGGSDFGIAEYRYLAEHAQSFSGLIAMRNGQRVKVADAPLQLTYVSGNYFRVLGVEMQRGRGFLEDEDRTGAPQAVAVISDDVWRNRFGAAPAMIGRTIRLDEIPFTVVGVTSGDFTGTNSLRNDLWIPLSARKLLQPNDPSVEAWLTSPSFCCSPMAGRLAPGATRERAAAELTTLTAQFRAANGMEAGTARIVLSGTAWITSPRKKRQIIPMLAVMFLAVTLVLLLACANVGNLLLARAAARRREIAVRLSLGGSRFRLVRQLLVESLLLGLAAGALGLAVAFVAPQAVVHRLDPEQAAHISPDLNVLCYTIATAVLSAIAFGLAPALHGTRGGIALALKSDAGLGRVRLPLRSILLAVQVAVSVILLINAGLLVRGLQRAQTIDPGFDVAHATVLSIDLPASEYTGPRTQALTRDLVAALDRNPDLPACGLALNPPLSNSTYSTSFQPVGASMGNIFSNEISPGFIGALGMRLSAGRNFVPEDGGRNVILINEAAARRWWPGESPVGKMAFSNGQMRQIVGVISNTYTNDLSSIEATIYFPVTGRWGAPFVLVRDRQPATLDRVGALVKQIEPRAQVHAEPLAASFQRKLEPSIYGSEFAGFLGLLALAIASIGMSGVFAYVVGQRTREIGVRMALGAPPMRIVGLVLTGSLRALAFGLLAGSAGAAGISALLAHALPGIQPLDPLAYTNVVLLLGAAVALASAVPARRATRVDPVRALRWE